MTRPDMLNQIATIIGIIAKKYYIIWAQFTGGDKKFPAAA